MLQLFKKTKELSFERTYPAPLAAVWAAWTEAEVLRQWWAPDKAVVAECEVDLQLGGEAEGLRIVREGLQPGDRVVINGIRKIFFPGMPVKPVVVPMDQPDLVTTPPADAAAPASAGSH